MLLPQTPGHASPPQSPPLLVSLPLPLTPEAACVARRATRDALLAWELLAEDWAWDVCLVVTELVTNALRHGGPRLRLELALLGGSVTVVVADGACGVPQPRASADDAESGRGMHLVEALCLAWGVDAEPDGKRVWARLQPPPGALHATPDLRPRG